MSRRKASLEGIGQSMLGRGVDLLFGDDDEAPIEERSLAVEADAALSEEELAHVFREQPEAQEAVSQAAEPANGRHAMDLYLRTAATALAQASDAEDQGRAAAVTETGDLDLPPLPEGSAAAVELEAAGLDLPPLPDAAAAELEGGDLDLPPLPEEAAATAELEASDLDLSPVPVAEPQEAAAAIPPTYPETPQPQVEQPVGQSSSQEEIIMPDQPAKPQEVDQPGVNGTEAVVETAAKEAVDDDDGKSKRVVGVVGDQEDAPDSIAEPEDRELTAEEAAEIMQRLTRKQITALKAEIDKLYRKLPDVLSGNSGLAKEAYGALHEARWIMLQEPARFADAEKLVQEVTALLKRIDRSDEQSSMYGVRLFLYQLAWILVFGFVAWFATVPDNPYARAIGGWIGTGSPLSTDVAGLIQGVATAATDAATVAAGAAGEAADATAAATAVATAVTNAAAAQLEIATAAIAQANEGFAWAMFLLSTLAWGGIGGVTSALWSLRYHVTVARDYEKIDNLWYYEQPVMGMVLGGIVYLVMAAGFLVVDANVTGPDASLGAKLLPAAIAVIFGFRQTVVLDLIDRAVKLVAPASNEQD